MIVALLNQKGGVGKTTLALHLAGRWAREGKRTIVIDADPQGSALDWSEQRAREGLPRLFGVIGLALCVGCQPGSDSEREDRPAPSAWLLDDPAAPAERGLPSRPS